MKSVKAHQSLGGALPFIITMRVVRMLLLMMMYHEERTYNDDAQLIANNKTLRLPFRLLKGRREFASG